MPLPMKEFEMAKPPKRRDIQGMIVKILGVNPGFAFSSKEMEDIIKVSRQSINQAFRSLERQGIVKRGFVQEGARLVCYVSLVGEEDAKENTEV